MSSQPQRPSPDWILSLRDMSGNRAKQRYRIDGETEITLSKRWRDMMVPFVRDPSTAHHPSG